MGTYRRTNKKKLYEQDELITATSKAISYLRGNLKSIIFITLIILIFISSFAGMMLYKDKLNKNINREIFFILKETKSQKKVPPQKIDALKKLENRLFGKNSYSNLYIGHFYYKNGRYEDAITEYKKVLESNSSPLMKQNAVIGMAYSHESLGKYKDAINILLKAIKENDKNLTIKEDMHISLARLYEESGDYKSAIEKYQFVIDKFPYIRSINEMKEKINNLKSISML